MVDAYRRFDRAFGNISHTICYAVKANSNLSILRLLADMGSGFDIVSAGELHRLRSIGVARKRAVFSGVGKTREEIREALRAEILLFNVESEAELDVLAAEAARFRRRASAALRVNPDVDAGGHAHISTGHHRHKFGIDWEDARRLYLDRSRSRWIAWQGVRMHLGSRIRLLADCPQADLLTARRVATNPSDLYKSPLGYTITMYIKEAYAGI
jgi:diaminopimelate decarboxylase